MIIGIPKEITDQENRVAICSAGVHALVESGHTVLLETGAGVGSGVSDEEYIKAGATIVSTPDQVWEAEMILKVKEPKPVEYDYFKEEQIIFTFLHLANEPELTKQMLAKKVTGIAYETIQLDDGSLPLLLPMSEAAGRMSVQIGAHYLEKHCGGKGILLGGLPGVAQAKVTILGGGIAGKNAAKMAIGLGAHVTILDHSPNRLRELDDQFDGRITTLLATSFNIAAKVREADLLIGAVLIPGAKAPRLVTEEMVKSMSPGSVIVDLSVDQGGCIETIDRRTSHSDPIYIKHGVIHYAVSNIAGAVARTSTLALTSATLDYVLEIANKGCIRAIRDNRALRKGINTMKGCLTYKAVAEALNIPHTHLEELLLF